MDLHIHSKYSFDSLSVPKMIVKFVKWKKLDVISITDHNSMKFYQNIRKFDDLTIIPGMEISTEVGDIIGLFLQEEVKTRKFFEVIDSIRDQDGIIVLPHPYHRRCDPELLIKHVDLIETANARYSNSKTYEKTKFLARSFKTQCLAGSDAHNYFEIGFAVSEIEGTWNDESELRNLILSNTRRLYCKNLPFLLTHGTSFLAARIKNWVKKTCLS
jgi:predicted metal-dependent phosphoesterase TrpH